MNAQPDSSIFEKLNFDNRFTRLLPGDPNLDNQIRTVSNACFSRVKPTTVQQPSLVAYAYEVAELLGLEHKQLIENTSLQNQFAEIFAGNHLLPNMDPYAMRYGGHQFGNWAGQLGDGRAINLGEVIHNSKRSVLQLKGSGPTPYSRFADGLAVLRSSIREFLCSEAMHHLGVPTTRALSLVTTGETVIRDMFYDGNTEKEPGAIVCRVAPSFLRFGSFEILAVNKELPLLQQLIDYTIETDFPELGSPKPDVYLEWFESVCDKTAEMITHWMRVGFVHGVMNTDNMSILGLTIDYGPYGWLENYDPNWTPNTTDAEGRRYCYKNQPYIAQWNLLQLANALFPVLKDAKSLETIISSFAGNYTSRYQKMLAEKLGLESFNNTTDDALIDELEKILPLAEVDMTLFYRALANIEKDTCLETSDNDALLEPLLNAYYDVDSLNNTYKKRIGNWLRNYIQRLRLDGTTDSTRKQKMSTVNPQYVLRNYLAQQAIEQAEQGEYSMIHELLDTLRQPYTQQAGKESFAEKRPAWARHKAGCSMLSCSS